ncbi:ABC transporter ATP-binding protein [Niveibacterium terrae]|uniref:ABC transporter ATP-binding protein n=1 Tax=Niveibacterium terrae TaxID=3373598 RepID=UPI003A9537DE
MRSFLTALVRFEGARRLSGLSALLLAATLADSLGYILLLPILQGLLNHQPPRMLNRFLVPLGLPGGWPPVFAMAGLLIVARMLFSHFREIHLARLRCGFVETLRVEIGRALLGAEWRYLAGLDHAHLLHTCKDDLGRISQGTFHILQIAVNGALVTGYLAAALWLSVPLTLVAAGLLGLAAWMIRHQLRQSQSLGVAFGKVNQQATATLQRLLQGLKIFKTFSVEAEQGRLLEESARRQSEEQIRFVRAQSRWRRFSELGGLSGLIAVFFLGWQVLHLPVAAILIFMLLVMRIVPAANQLQQNFQLLGHMLPAFASLQSILRDCRAARETPVAPQGLTPPTMLKLDRVSVFYPGKRALDAVSLDMPRNSILGLVGPSGAGKSTLADVMLGLLPPDEGAFLLDNVPLGAQTRLEWRHKVAYVPQDALLLPGTVRDNLKLARPDADDEALWHALEDAAAADFVRQRPEGLDSPVGERGGLFSGGERQRLALARALLRDPWLLVLDEVTSQLDAENEAKIAQSIARLRGKVGIVIVAHRPALLELADFTVRLENGQRVVA